MDTNLYRFILTSPLQNHVNCTAPDRTAVQHLFQPSPALSFTSSRYQYTIRSYSDFIGVDCHIIADICVI